MGEFQATGLVTSMDGRGRPGRKVERPCVSQQAAGRQPVGSLG